MLQTLRSKILFYLLLVSMIGILFVSFFMQWGFEESFKSYLDRNREKKIERIIVEIEKDYKKMAILPVILFLVCSMSMR